MLHVFLVGVHNEVNEHVKQRQEVGSTPTMGELSSERSFSSRQAFNRYRTHVLLVGVRINTGIPVYCIIIRGRKISYRDTFFQYWYTGLIDGAQNFVMGSV